MSERKESARIPIKGRVDVELTPWECRHLSAFLDAEGTRRFRALPPAPVDYELVHTDRAAMKAVMAFVEWQFLFEYHPVRRQQLLCDELLEKVGRKRAGSITVQFEKRQAKGLGEIVSRHYADAVLRLPESVLPDGRRIPEYDHGAEMRALGAKLITAGTRGRGRPPNPK